jgi:Leucine-rich repeat (LRR) protein
MKLHIVALISVLLLSGAGCTGPAAPVVPGETNTNPNPASSALSNTANKAEGVLDLSSRNLKKVPMEIFNNQNITELDLSNNKLTGALPAEIRRLTKLKILNISNNNMTGLPAELGQLSNLEILDAANNQLTGLPYELGNLKNLKVFNLKNNNYSTPDLERIRKNLPGTNFILN